VVDNNPLPGVSYYRLTQTDFDNEEEIFRPVAVTMPGVSLSNLYPNPVNTSHIKYKISSDIADVATLSIIDVNGRIAIQKTIPLQRGANEIATDVSALEAGIYLIRLSGSSIRNKVQKHFSVE